MKFIARHDVNASRNVHIHALREKVNCCTNDLMIQLTQREGRTAVIMTCDVCNQRIVDSQMAMMRFKDVAEGETSSELIFCHKGECDKKLSATRPRDAWWELDHFYMRLILNSGMTPESVRDALGDIVDLQKLP